jgi:hypothetical protein
MTMASLGGQQVNFRNWLAELDGESRERFQSFLDIAAEALSGFTPATPKTLGQSDSDLVS